MTRQTRKGRFFGKFHGLSLIEAMLALSLGAIVASQGYIGANNYSQSLKVQASASMLSRLTAAADRYAEDNFKTLLARAPQELPISVLTPYYGPNIGKDAFRTDYKLSTRTYNYNVSDGGTGTRSEKALQVLVVGEHDPKGPVATDSTLRAEIANTAGSGAGFITTSTLTCQYNNGAATRTPGNICGSFGNYSFSANTFPATDFNGANSNPLDGASLVSLVTKGDSSVYGDQLYRYDFGDPELNTMHTDLDMDNNDIIDPDRIVGVNEIQVDGGSQKISTRTGALSIEAAGSISLNPGNNNVRIQDDNGVAPVIHGSNGRLTLGQRNDYTSLGPIELNSISGKNGTRTRYVGTGRLYADDAYTNQVNTNEVNSLHADEYDALRLQNRALGEVIVGKRIRYKPSGTGGPTYEISDGKITAQTLNVQDITCADCGGSLSNLLPKWRQMGSYYIDSGYFGTLIGTFVPYPECTDTRRTPTNRNSTGEDPAYRETAADNRYEPKIVIVPKELGMDFEAKFKATYAFYARKGPTGWSVFPRVSTDSTQALTPSQAGKATGLASTFCVFTGGSKPDPTNKTNSNFQRSSGTNWLRLD